MSKYGRIFFLAGGVVLIGWGLFSRGKEGLPLVFAGGLLVFGFIAVAIVRRFGIGKNIRLSLTTIPIGIAGLLLGGWLGALSGLGRFLLEWLNPDLLAGDLSAAVGATIGGLLGMATGLVAAVVASRLWSEWFKMRS